jgi:2-polyprenyl-3-methyl-5-hydroxy-6-metoxy-1,4-benzoquinol methylase
VATTKRLAPNDELVDYWATYYRDVVDDGQPWLDYSNGRVQAQTFALALEGAGPVTGLRCLDVGCGWGQLTRIVGGLGAPEPTGMDIVPELIASLQESHPGHRWICGSPTDEALLESLGQFDVVFAVEVLQVVPLEAAVMALWQRVAPAGRLIGVVANGSCPIVQRTEQRFPGKYLGLDVASVTSVIEQLDQVAAFGLRGMFFQEDQRLVPYQAGAWSTTPSWEDPPNRIQFVVQKTG